jgi:hypothetical protein
MSAIIERLLLVLARHWPVWGAGVTEHVPHPGDHFRIPARSKRTPDRQDDPVIRIFPARLSSMVFIHGFLARVSCLRSVFCRTFVANKKITSEILP